MLNTHIQKFREVLGGTYRQRFALPSKVKSVDLELVWPLTFQVELFSRQEKFKFLSGIPTWTSTPIRRKRVFPRILATGLKLWNISSWGIIYWRRIWTGSRQITLDWWSTWPNITTRIWKRNTLKIISSLCAFGGKYEWILNLKCIGLGSTISWVFPLRCQKFCRKFGLMSPDKKMCWYTVPKWGIFFQQNIIFRLKTLREVQRILEITNQVYFRSFEVGLLEFHRV